jgi:ATP adenylyltransferase
METLWSPWRSKYIGTFKDGQHQSESSCFLCDAANQVRADSESYVVARRKNCFGVLNLYPYNNGHILIAPYRHIGDFLQLTIDETSDIMSLLQESVAALRQIYGPHGFNIGANIGHGSGAGVPDHIHFHIVPRWNGDTSFISTLSDTKIVSVAIEDTWRQLSEILHKG